MPAQDDPIQTPRRIVIALNHADEMFVAPAVNPFSAKEMDILGKAGIDHLRQRVREQWPRATTLQHLVIQLPANELPRESNELKQLTQQMQAALRRYCAQQVERNRQEQRLSWGFTQQKFVIALLVTLIAVLLLAALANGWLSMLSPFVQGIVVLLPILAASLALWDALESIVFGWTSFSIENRAYRAISTLTLAIEGWVETNTNQEKGSADR